MSVQTTTEINRTERTSDLIVTQVNGSPIVLATYHFENDRVTSPARNRSILTVDDFYSSLQDVLDWLMYVTNRFRPVLTPLGIYTLRQERTATGLEQKMTISGLEAKSIFNKADYTVDVKARDSFDLSWSTYFYYIKWYEAFKKEIEKYDQFPI